MKPKYNNDRCPVCGMHFTDLIGEYEFTCPECYTELKVKYFNEYSQRLGMTVDEGYYIDPDDYRPLKNTPLNIYQFNN